MDELHALVRAHGLRLIEGRGQHAAGYLPDRAIRVEPGLSWANTRSLVHHELGHHALGHRPQPAGIVHDRQERAANEWAARRLITCADYRAAEALHGGHVPSLAHALTVHPKIVTAYRAMLERIGETVYVSPRMGIGQYDDRLAA